MFSFFVLEYEILEHPRKRRRRNSDSNLYCKARKVETEQTENQLERGSEGGGQFDFDKRMLVEKYLQNIQETHSVMTETSDSGIRTLGATSEIEMEDISGNYFILVVACQSPKCLLDSSVTFQQDRKTPSYSATTCNQQGKFSEARCGKNFRSFESALGVNEILDRDWVLLNCGSADRGTSEQNMKL